MSVLINFKICDNVEECGGIEACPVNALYWDDKKKTVAIDNSKCINCGKCEEACPIDAIKVAKTDQEYKKIKKEIDKDPRKASDLFIDRYGAQPIHPGFLISQSKFNSYVVQIAKPIVVELFKKELLECLLRSIPIKELFKNKDINYKKVEAKDDSLLKKYKIKQLPSLLFFKKGKLIGKIEGYYDIDQKKELIEKIKIIKLA